MENYRISKMSVIYPNNEKQDIDEWVYDKNGLLKSIITNKNEKEGIFIYENKLLSSIEEYCDGNKSKYYEYEYELDNSKTYILSKRTDKNLNGNLKSYTKYIFENDLIVKTLNYSSENILKYELINKYDCQNRRVCTYRNNIIHYAEQDMYYLYSARKYNEKELLEEIFYYDGTNIKYLWELGFTTYDINKYY